MESVQESDCINYIPIPTLESIAIVSIVTTLWKHADIRQPIQEHVLKFMLNGRYLISSREKNFDEIEQKVSEKLSLLSLPNLLEVKVYNFIKPIGYQLLDWVDCIKSHHSNFHIPIELFYWTQEGIIDRGKTIELLYVTGNLMHDVLTVYCIACEHCYHDFIVNLWDQMGQSPKEELNEVIRSEKCVDLDELVLYWTCLVQNDQSNFKNYINLSNRNNNNPYHYMFNLSITVGNVSAAKYFWQYLTYEEICTNIEKWADEVAYHRKRINQPKYQRTNKYTDILCFLLSNMNDKEKQKKVFKKYNDMVLEWLFLDWPWQKFLLPTMRTMWDFLEGVSFVKLLYTMSSQIKEGRNIETLIREIWLECPQKFKRCFFQTGEKYIYNCTHVFLNLLENKDVKSVQLILNDVSPEEKNQISVSMVKNKDKLFEIIHANNIEMLDMLIRETPTSQWENNNF